MKTIAQKFAEAVQLLQAAEGNHAHASVIARLRLEAHFQFWIEWLVILDPLGTYGAWGSAAIFNSRASLLSEPVSTESLRLLKQKLGVRRLTFGTLFKLREILRDACQMAKDRPDVDVALCALMVFVQLELGAEPDPEYGNFPRPELPTYGLLDDADLPDDPLGAEILLERHGMFDGFSSSEYREMMWSQKWEEITSDPAQFEVAFPGMGYRQANVARALGPIFKNSDSTLVLDPFLRWARLLLRNPLEENRIGPEQKPDAAEAA